MKHHPQFSIFSRRLRRRSYYDQTVWRRSPAENNIIFERFSTLGIRQSVSLVAYNELICILEFQPSAEIN